MDETNMCAPASKAVAVTLHEEQVLAATRRLAEAHIAYNLAQAASAAAENSWHEASRARRAAVQMVDSAETELLRLAQG